MVGPITMTMLVMVILITINLVIEEIKYWEED